MLHGTFTATDTTYGAIPKGCYFLTLGGVLACKDTKSGYAYAFPEGDSISIPYNTKVYALDYRPIKEDEVRVVDSTTAVPFHLRNERIENLTEAARRLEKAMKQISRAEDALMRLEGFLK